jgi:hypothetical protein
MTPKTIIIGHQTKVGITAIAALIKTAFAELEISALSFDRDMPQGEVSFHEAFHAAA